jgi:hypothetical protein
MLHFIQWTYVEQLNSLVLSRLSDNIDDIIRKFRNFFIRMQAVLRYFP